MKVLKEIDELLMYRFKDAKTIIAADYIKINLLDIQKNRLSGFFVFISLV